MRRATVLTLMALCLSPAFAEDKINKLAGSFTKKAGDQELKFVFGKDRTFRFSMTSGSDGCEMDAKYTIDKDGTLKCETTKFEKKGNFPVEKPKGYLFSFKAELKDKTVRISDFKGDEINEEAKSVVEGEYTKDN